MDNVYASPLLLADIWRVHGTEDVIVVSPDVGGVVRARAIAKRLDDAELAIIDKRRPRANVATVMNIIGDVEGKTCVLVDDIVDTAGTLCAAANALKERGARKVVAYCMHPVLSGAAMDNLNKSALDELVVTDTIAAVARGPRLQQDPPAQRGRTAGRNHPPDGVRRVGQLAVRRLIPHPRRRPAGGAPHSPGRG